MTILPKKKTGKERLEERRQREQLNNAAAGGAEGTSGEENSGKETNKESAANAAAGGGGVARKKMKAAAAENTGYNSGDEDRRGLRKKRNEEDELETRFEEHLHKAKGFSIKKMRGDGACLFRAVADQVYGDEEMHATVRKLCMDYMAKNSDHFSQFITEDFNDYIARKRQDHTHGNHVEMHAIAEIFNRPIEIYEYSTEPINTFQPEGGKENPPLRLSYHGTVHYNSVVDPFAATIGVGLGLPGYIPGLAEQTLMRDAVRASEAHEIEEAMLKDKMSLTDWQATDQHLSEQIARESYLEFLKEREQQMKERNVPCHSGSLPKPRSPSGSSKQQQPCSPISCKPCKSPLSSTSVTGSSSPLNNESAPSSNSPNQRGGALGPVRPSETTSLLDELPASAFGLTDWGDEGDMLAQVLAMSQQEYLDSLKSNRDDQPGSSSS